MWSNSPSDEKTDPPADSQMHLADVHGIFDDREVADALIGALLEEKGYGEEAMHSMDYHAYKEKQYQILANAVRENMDMKKIYEIIEKGNAAECFI